MSRPPATAIAVFAGIILAVMAVRAWFPGDERIIRRGLTDLADAASIAGDEPPLARMTRAIRIGRHFAEDATLNLGEPYRTIQGRDAITGLAARAPLPRGGMTVEFVDVDVQVAPDGRRATVHLTAKVSGAEPGSTHAMLDAREFELQVNKGDDGWVIARIDGVMPLERP